MFFTLIFFTLIYFFMPRDMIIISICLSCQKRCTLFPILVSFHWNEWLAFTKIAFSSPILYERVNLLEGPPRLLFFLQSLNRVSEVQYFLIKLFSSFPLFSIQYSSSHLYFCFLTIIFVRKQLFSLEMFLPRSSQSFRHSFMQTFLPKCFLTCIWFCVIDVIIDFCLWIYK